MKFACHILMLLSSTHDFAPALIFLRPRTTPKIDAALFSSPHVSHANFRCFVYVLRGSTSKYRDVSEFKTLASIYGKKLQRFAASFARM